MLRTFMYPSAVAPASPIIISFVLAATDAALARPAVIRPEGCGLGALELLVLLRGGG